MFKINDYIMYGKTGVCEVSDIVKVTDRYKVENEYYVLNPVYDNRTIIKIPVNNSNNRVIMRPILSKIELKSIISTVDEDKIDWIDDNKQRLNDFNSIIKLGDCGELVKLIRTLLLKQSEKELLEKKLSQSDKNILNLAEKLVNEEISVILDIDQDDVKSYIQRNINREN